MGTEDFERELDRTNQYIGRMNVLANSIDLMLDVILEKLNIPPPKMLGRKINTFEKCEQLLERDYNENIDNLVSKLNKFNETWIITKHGMVIGGSEYITIYKDGYNHIFDPKKQSQIDQEFSTIMADLVRISKFDFEKYNIIR